MAQPSLAGFTIVRNATILDFPLEPSLRSLLPVVDELVVNVGASDDDTRRRVEAIADPKIRIVDSVWDRALGPAMLAHETDRAMAACRAEWGIYIQADEVLAPGSAARLRDTVARAHADRRVEGVVVDYLHFYGGFDTVARSRKWYRREVRAVRLGVGVHSYRDAQGFRVGPDNRRVVALRSDAVMLHYGWARPADALAAKRAEDGRIEPKRLASAKAPLVSWVPGLVPFRGQHPAEMERWIADRRGSHADMAPFRFRGEYLRFAASAAIERVTGWRPFEFRNYTLLRAR